MKTEHKILWNAAKSIERKVYSNKCILKNKILNKQHKSTPQGARKTSSQAQSQQKEGNNKDMSENR